MSVSDFERVHAQYRNMVMKIAYDVLKDRDLAEDACQESFITLFQSKSVEIAVSENTQKYLAVIAKCRAIDIYRKKQRQEEVSLDDMENMKSGISMEEQVINENMLSIAIDDLMKNKPDLYEALVHVSVYGESAKEAAQKLGITVTSVRTRNFRALKYIEKVYGQDLL